MDRIFTVNLYQVCGKLVSIGSLMAWQLVILSDTSGEETGVIVNLPRVIDCLQDDWDLLEQEVDFVFCAGIDIHIKKSCIEKNSLLH